MELEIDLISDWYNEIVKQMKKMNLEFNETKNRSTLVIEYINYLRKRDIGKKWKVYKSKEFKCPPEYRKTLKNIENTLENGGDIYPYLSTKIDNLSFKDGLFNDWGVLHLHLGDEPHPTRKGFMSRTGPLVFIYKDNGNAYFLGIFNHGDWTNRKVLQTIQSNWPEILDKYRVSEATGITSKYTDQEYFQLRQAGAIVFIELEDKDGNPTVIGPPHFGIVTSGHSIIDVQQHDYEYEVIKEQENIIRQNIEYIKGKILSNSMELPKKLQFNFIIQNNGLPFVREKNTGLGIRFF